MGNVSNNVYLDFMEILLLDYVKTVHLIVKNAIVYKYAKFVKMDSIIYQGSASRFVHKEHSLMLLNVQPVRISVGLVLMTLVALNANQAIF